MYCCGNCGAEFPSFKTAGQCPRCGCRGWVTCTGCHYSDHASAFIEQGNRCPRCGRAVGEAAWRMDPTVAAFLGAAMFIALCLLFAAVGGAIWGLRWAGDAVPSGRLAFAVLLIAAGIGLAMIVAWMCPGSKLLPWRALGWGARARIIVCAVAGVAAAMLGFWASVRWAGRADWLL